MPTFTVCGTPIGKARPRVTRHGTFTPKKTREYEKLVRHEYTAQCGDAFFAAHVPLRITLRVYMKPPKSTPKKRRRQMLDGLIFPTKKPDCSNILKSIEDALNDVAYVDDSQIVEVMMIKFYDEIPRVDVDLEEVEV